MQVDIEQKPRTYVVLNPVAGVSEPGSVREKIESALQSRDVPVEIYETTGEEDIKQLVREAVKKGFQLFISAGGDGTLSSVIDGLVGTEIPLVIIPTGTWNALARALDIPLQVDQAVDLLFQEHSIRTIDAMDVNGSYFVLSVSAGICRRVGAGEERILAAKSAGRRGKPVHRDGAKTRLPVRGGSAPIGKRAEWSTRGRLRNGN